MSSEFDEYFSFENYLQDDLDTGLAANDLDSVDTQTQDQHEDADSQMLDLPTGGFDLLGGEALQQPCTLVQPSSSPWSEVAFEQLPALQGTPTNLDATGESAGKYYSGTSPPLQAELQEANRLGQMDQIIRQWIGATNCPWPECSSKATFKHLSSLRTHLMNIHVSPLICAQPGCSYKRPFGKLSDLNRHTSTAHDEIRKHKCPISNCKASLDGFSRKDKLVKHLREEHENLKCPYNHCFSSVVASKEDDHVRDYHGNFECNLEGCVGGLASCFSETNLKRHLRWDHGLHWDAVWDIIKYVKEKGFDVFTATQSKIIGRIKNCKTCSSQQHAKGSK